MPKKGFILWIFVESPLHAGTGSGLGEIDLPIQRERITGLPYIQASGIKGALRAFCTENRMSPDTVQALFGPETTQAHEHAGALSVSDARLLLFPIRSLAGVWAWGTSPLLLGRLKRDYCQVGKKLPLSDTDLSQTLSVSTNSCLILPHTQPQKVMLEDFSYEVKSAASAEAVADFLKQGFPTDPPFWRDELAKHLILLPDDELRFFAEHATEVVTRVRIDHASKTVQEGALWTEELLPAETLLYVVGLVNDLYRDSTNGSQHFSAKDLADDLYAALNEKRLQLGGDSTLGRGWCHIKMEM